LLSDNNNGAADLFIDNMNGDSIIIDFAVTYEMPGKYRLRNNKNDISLPIDTYEKIKLDNFNKIKNNTQIEKYEFNPAIGTSNGIIGRRFNEILFKISNLWDKWRLKCGIKGD